MAKAVEVNEPTAKLHTHLGMSTRRAGPALCSTCDPVGRKRHVMSPRIGEKNVFFVDIEVGRKLPSELIAAVLADPEALEVFLDTAEAHGYERDTALALLQGRDAKAAKVPSLSELKAQKAAAKKAAEG